jgi:flagellar motor switch protein FliM
VKLAQGQIGQRSGKVAVRLVNDVSSDKKVKQ